MSIAGAFVRQDARFRCAPDLDPAPGKYHLYVARACPWSHRAIIVRALQGLEDLVGISFAHPYRDERGWAFPGGGFIDRLHGWSLLSQAYDATDPDYDGRISVPVLWDTEAGVIVCNESADIVRIFNLWGDGPDLYPDDLAEEIDALEERIYEQVNNGVYRAGFARSQEAYEAAVADVFDGLDWLEDLLGERRFLTGDAITEADWRLFVTLVRFDEVYHLHFRCNRRRVEEYPNLWAYTRSLYQQPGVADTVAMDEIKRHYYTTHDSLNPKRLIPVGPAPDWWAPHGRGCQWSRP